jgi:hypothetical protein
MLFSCTSLHATAVAPLADRGSPASRRRLYICCCDSSIGTRLLPAGRLYIVCCRCVDSIVAPSSAWGDCKCYLVKIRPSRLGGRGRAGAEGTVGNPICLTLLLQSYMHSFIHPAPPACLAAEPPARSRLLSEGGQPNVAMQGELRAVRPAQSEPWSLVHHRHDDPCYRDAHYTRHHGITWPCSLHLSTVLIQSFLPLLCRGNNTYCYFVTAVRAHAMTALPSPPGNTPRCIARLPQSLLAAGGLLSQPRPSPLAV